eukprot:scaffold416330_cov25-Prasinocladus_malaysianus.AAC.1
MQLCWHCVVAAVRFHPKHLVKYPYISLYGQLWALPTALICVRGKAVCWTDGAVDGGWDWREGH